MHLYPVIAVYGYLSNGCYWVMPAIQKWLLHLICLSVLSIFSAQFLKKALYVVFVRSNTLTLAKQLIIFPSCLFTRNVNYIR
jgi:hypothetical protein